MLISLVCTLTQTRMGVGRVIFLSKGPMRDQCFPYCKIRALYGRFLLHIISADSVSYFLKMIMLISLLDTLTQTRIDIDRVTFYS